MCGIAGAFVKNSKLTSESIKAMTDSLAHRGPDGEGQWLNAAHTLGLGHRRLSIIDLSTAASQPMVSSDSRYVISFNGEIYNYIELKSAQEKLGEHFRSQSDTEVLLSLYRTKGVHMLQELDGMFSFAIYDTVEDLLFCARDRFGEKPFYFYHVPGRSFHFASEMKALFKAGVQRNINHQLLYNYLATSGVQNPYNPSDTFYESVSKLEASHYLIINRDLQLIKKRYWSLPLKQHSALSFEDAKAEFRQLLTTSVKKRLRSDVQVGSSLSGGLDSSTIVSIITGDLKIPANTFSAVFPGYEKDESHYIKQLLAKTGANGHFTSPDAAGFADEIERVFYHQEEPFSSASIFAQWSVMKLAATTETKVLLDGQGADEILGGYTYYYRTYFQELYRSDKNRYKEELESYSKLGHKHFEQDLRFKVSAKFPKLYNSYLKMRSGPVTHPDMHDSYYTAYKDSTYKAIEFSPSLNHHMHLTLSVNGMFEALLRYADRNSMAFAREVRLPFLDHKLVEFLYSLPSDYKIKNGWTKYLLRKSYESLLPSEITWRKEKIGYAAPEERWLTNERMKSMMSDAISFLCKRQILDSKNIRKDKAWVYLMVYFLLKNE